MSLIKSQYKFALSRTAAIMLMFAVAAVFGLVSADTAFARGGGGRGGGGGGRGGGFSRPAPRPSAPSGGYSRPATRPSTPSAGYTRPATRPSTGGGYGAGRPTTRPGYPPSNIGVSRPNVGGNRPINTGNINTGTINVNNGWHGDYDDDWGAFAAGAVIGGVTGAAIAGSSYPSTTYVAPTNVYSLPPSCTPTVVNGQTYQYCNGTYYAPTYQGADVVYQTVPAP